MTWRRGFFRLWLVASILWGGAVYLLGQPGHDIYSEAIVDLPQGPGIVVPLDISDAGMRKALTDYHKANLSPGFDSAPLIERDAALIKEEINDKLSRNASERRYQWRQFALASIGGPAIFLAIGAVIVWVLAGFHRRSGQP